MIIQLLVFFFLLLFLFLLTQKITTRIYHVFHLITLRQKFSLYLMTFIFIPGTIVHELSHLIMAIILRVPAGRLSVIPKLQDGEVKAGQLEIGKVDPFRTTIVGIAPLISGLLIIYFLCNQLFSNTNYSDIQSLILNSKFLILNYILFIISTTMFSSRKDLESLMIAGPVITAIFLTLYFFGVRIVFEKNLLTGVEYILKNLNIYLSISLIIDGIIYGIVLFNLLFFQKILKRKIV